ncbi:MAG: glycosyl transferase family 2 [Bacteroidetes bacterium]|nr:glycosyl transferase family 2 [Bacteroidota bacterium]
MDLSVIIVNYNVRQFLENSLTSILRAMEGLHGEIIVVDNASDDGSAGMVRATFPQVRLITNPTNVGFARANNLALKEASGDFILLINPDTIVQEDTFRVMLRFLRDHPEAGLAGCKILNPDGSFQLACRRSFPTPWVAFTKIFGLSALFPSSRLFGRYNLTYLDPNKSYPVDAVSGSFMMMTRSAYTRVGGLDETFFMYGEDLDWCYRVRQAGFQVYYVHETQIVHFKGESTRRSNIDEVRVFYGAMELFVQKHFSHSRLGVFFLRLGIVLRAAAASLNRVLQPLLFALIDFCLVAGAIILAEWLYFGKVFRYQSYAYPIVWTVPGLLVVAVGAFAGLYATHRFAIARAGAAVVVSYLVISAIVFFVKTFAFSRAVVLISGLLAFVVVPGWRLLVRLWGRRGGRSPGKRSLFGSRTLIVGVGTAGQEVLRKLRARVDGGYDIVGFIDTSSARIGEVVTGVEVVGSVENVGKIIEERRITDVIFSTDDLPYTTILAVIARSSSRNVNFRLVPTSLEAIIGKTRIDDLDPLPLVQIDYSIHRPFNRVVKRSFDVIVSLLLMATLYPAVKGLRALRLVRRDSSWMGIADDLPRVLNGTISFVGLPPDEEHVPGATTAEGPYLGPRGLTGLVQLNQRAELSKEERERFELYYAKNQSLWLDVEILVRALLQLVRR